LAGIFSREKFLVIVQPIHLIHPSTK